MDVDYHLGVNPCLNLTPLPTLQMDRVLNSFVDSPNSLLSEPQSADTARAVSHSLSSNTPTGGFDLVASDLLASPGAQQTVVKSLTLEQKRQLAADASNRERLENQPKLTSKEVPSCTAPTRTTRPRDLTSLLINSNLNSLNSLSLQTASTKTVMFPSHQTGTTMANTSMVLPYNSQNPQGFSAPNMLFSSTLSSQQPANVGWQPGQMRIPASTGITGFTRIPNGAMMPTSGQYTPHCVPPSNRDNFKPLSKTEIDDLLS